MCRGDVHLEESCGDNPVLSFVTPTLDSIRTLDSTIESVKREAAGYWYEHIFVDGGSSDGTLERIKSESSKKVRLIHGERAGPYAAMNCGIAAARGNWVGIINSDDYYLPKAMETVLNTAIMQPEVDFIYGDIVMENGSARWERRPKHGWRAILGRGYPVWHPATFVKRRVYAQLGAYDTRYRIAADHEFFYRMIDSGIKRKYVPHCLTLVRTGGLSDNLVPITTFELLDIHRRRRGWRGVAAHGNCYLMRRLRQHPCVPKGWGYWVWAFRGLSTNKPVRRD